MGVPIGPRLPEGFVVEPQTAPVPEGYFVVQPTGRPAMTSIVEGLRAGTVGAVGSVGGTLEAAGKSASGLVDELIGNQLQAVRGPVAREAAIANVPVASQVEQMGAALRGKAKFAERYTQPGPSLEDVVRGKGSTKDFLLSGVASSIPSIAAVAGTTGIAALAGAPATIAGGAAGIMSYVLNTGEIYNNLRDKGVDPVKAARLSGIVGIPVAALDTLYIKGFLKEGIIQPFAKRVAEGVAKEGLTEGGQELLGVGAETVAGVPPTPSEAAWRFAGATVIGGVTGGIGSAIAPRSKHGQVDTKPMPTGPEPMRPEAILDSSRPLEEQVRPPTPAPIPAPQVAPTPVGLPAPTSPTEVTTSEGTPTVAQGEGIAPSPPVEALPVTIDPLVKPSPTHVIQSREPGTTPLVFEPIDLAEARSNPLLTFGLDTTDAGSLGASLSVAVANARTSDLARARISLAVEEARNAGFDGAEVAGAAAEAARSLNPNLTEAEAKAAVEPFLSLGPDTTVEKGMEAVRQVFSPTPVSNPYEQDARVAKATALVDLFHQSGIAAEQLVDVTDDQWKQVAQAAGVNPPSPDTRALVTRLLTQREQSENSSLHANPVGPILRAARSLLTRRKTLNSLIPLAARQQASVGSAAQRSLLTARQLSWQAPNFQPLQDLVRVKDQIDSTANYFKMQGEEILTRWQGLSARENKGLARFHQQAHVESLKLGRRLTVPELASLPEKLNPHQVVVYDATDKFIQDGIVSLEGALQRRIASQQGSAAGTSPTANQLAQAKNENFFPTTGFGPYLVLDQTNNQIYRTDTEAEQKGMAAALRANGATVATDRLTSAELAFAGVPYKMVKDLIDSLPMGKASRAKLVHLAYRDSSANTSAYDAERAIAQFSQRMGNFIPRAYYRTDLHNTVDAARAYGDDEIAMGQDATATRAMEQWMDHRVAHILNPESHYQALKSALFTKFFWALPKQAAVNLTQVPLNTFPALSSYLFGTGTQIGPVNVNTPGEVKATRILARAMTDVREMFNPSYARRLTPDERMMLLELTNEGILDQTYASTVGAIAHGSPIEEVLTRARLPRNAARIGAHFVRWGLDRGTRMFSVTEEFNRRITALSAFRAGVEKGEKDPTAVARRMVQSTQGSYEGSNIPRAFTGRANVLYIFRTYLQNQLYFYRHEPGGTRGLLMLAAAAGLMGLPFAENLADVMDLLLTKAKEFLKLPHPKTDVRQWMREYFNQVFGGSEVLMNGLSRHADSLVDISGSLSMGNILPTEGATKGLMGAMKSERAMLRTLEEMGGIAGAQGMNFMRASMTYSPEGVDWLNTVMPQATKNWLDTYRQVQHGQFETAGGKKLVPIDLHDSWSQAEVMAKLLGFQPARVSRERDAKYSYVEEYQYYTTRRELMLGTMVVAIKNKNPELTGAATSALVRFNNDVPNAYKWSTDQLRKAVEERLANKYKEDAGYPLEEKMYEVQKRFRESFR